MATGLTLDELSALSAPWFLDRAYVDAYTTAIFANNRLLAQSIGSESAVFGPHCHPSRSTPGAAAPFCALQLCEASPARYRRLAEIVERQSEQRGLLLTKGGSFGFRGHRFELIEPAPGQGDPFLRIAMGWRDGHSSAASPSFWANSPTTSRSRRWIVPTAGNSAAAAWST